MSFSTTTSSRFTSIPGDVDSAPGPTDNCNLKTTLKFSKKKTNRSKGVERSKKSKRSRPASAIQAAADAAAISTSFGTSGRGEASHWNWVKSGKRPPKVLSASLEKQRDKDMKKNKKKGGRVLSAGPETTENKKTRKNIRKRMFEKPRKHPSLFDRAPLDVENYICSHAHVGNKYYGSFGFRQGKSSREGSFSKAGRNDQWRMPTASHPGPNQYGDVDVGFASVGKNKLNKDKRVQKVRNEQYKTKNYNKAVALLKDPLPGELYKNIVMKNSKKCLVIADDDRMKKKDVKYLLASLEKTGLTSLLKNKKKRDDKENIQNMKKIKKKIRSLSMASLQSNFASPGLGGTESRFTTASGTFMPGPGQYGDVNSFIKPKSKPHTSTARPHSALAALSPLKDHRNNNSNTIPQGGILHTQVSTFGASRRDSAAYQRRFGIGVGGQDSPGPAYAALSNRNILKFGNRLKSSNSIIRLQEEQARKYNEYNSKSSEDPDQIIQKKISKIRKRAQSARPIRDDHQRDQKKNSLYQSIPTSPFSRSLIDRRPMSAQSSPDLRTYISSSSSSSPSSSTNTTSEVRKTTIRGGSVRKFKKKQRPTSASPGPKSPSSKGKRRPQSSKLVRRGSVKGSLSKNDDRFDNHYDEIIKSKHNQEDDDSDDDGGYYDDFENVEDVEHVEHVEDEEGKKKENLKPKIMKKESAAELHLKKLLRKQKKLKLKEELRLALVGVAKAARKARTAADRVLKK